MVTYIWRTTDDKVVYIDGTIANEEIQSDIERAREYAAKLVNDQSAFQNAFNTNVKPYLSEGEVYSDYWSPDDTCLYGICSVCTTVHKDRGDSRAESTLVGDKSKVLYIDFYNIIGSDGTNGVDGESQYIHVVYGDLSNDGKYVIKDNGAYLGVTYNKYKEGSTEWGSMSGNTNIYSWSKIKGEDGVGKSVTWSDLSEEQKAALKNELKGKDGKDGENGISGNAGFKSIVFKRVNSTPSRPSAAGTSYSNPIPTGWSDGIPGGDDKMQVWMSTRIFTTDGTYPQTSGWTEPQPVSDSEFIDFEFSDSETKPAEVPNKTRPSDVATNGWKNESNENVVWMAMCKVNNGEYEKDQSGKPKWSVSRIKGENGTNGESLNLKGEVENESDLKFLTGKTGDSYVCGGWLYVYEPSDYSEITGHWRKVCQFTGNSSYLHIKYANTATQAEIEAGISFEIDGVQCVFTGDEYLGEEPGKYMGVMSDDVLEDSSDPSDYRWSRVEGKDGFGMEYIFKASTGETSIPDVPTRESATNPTYWDENFQKPDFVPEGWSDDPISITSQSPCVWSCMRRYIDNEWSNFTGDRSNPGKASLYAKYGKDASSPVFADLTNEMDSIIANSEGKFSGEVRLGTEVKLYYGLTDITSYTTITFNNGGQKAGVVCSNVGGTCTFVVTDAVADRETVDIKLTANYMGETHERTLVFTINKVRSGENGTSPVMYRLNPSNSVIKRDKNGNYIPTSITCNVAKTVGSVTDGNWPVTAPYAVKYSIDGGSESVYSSAVATTGITNNLTFKLYYNDVILDTETIIVVSDGVDGSSASNVIIGDLSNDMDSIVCGSDGTWTGNVRRSTVVSLYKGITAMAITGITVSDETGVSLVSTATTGEVVLDFASSMDDSTSVTITASALEEEETISRDVTYTISKVKTGEKGENAVVYALKVDKSVITYDPNNSMYSPALTDKITCSIVKTVGNQTPVTYSYDTRPSGLSIKYMFGSAGSTEVAYESNKTLSQIGFNADKLSITYKLYYNTTLLDSETVPVIQSGLSGQTGEAGKSAIVADLSNDNDTIITGSEGLTTSVYKETNISLYEGTTQLKVVEVAHTNPAGLALFSADIEKEYKHAVCNLTFNSGLNASSRADVVISAKTSDGIWRAATYTVTLLRNGRNGENALSYSINSDTSVLARKNSKTTPSAVTISVVESNGSGITTYASNNLPNLLKLYYLDDSTETEFSGAIGIDTGRTKDLTVLLKYNGTIVDRETIPVIAEGTDGKGVSAVTEYYYATSTTSIPGFNKDTWSANTMPGNYNAVNKYLWNVTVSEYSDGTMTQSNASLIGNKGKEISAITEYYAVASGDTYAPAGWNGTNVPPTPGDIWKTNVSAITASDSEPYYWNFEMTKYTDNDVYCSQPHVIGMKAQNLETYSPPIVRYRGEWKTTDDKGEQVTYISNSNYIDIVHYANPDVGTGPFFKVVRGQSIYNVAPTGSNIGTYWEDMGTDYEQLSTGLLLANEAIVSNLAVDKLKTASDGQKIVAEGNTLYSEDSQNYRVLNVDGEYKHLNNVRDASGGNDNVTFSKNSTTLGQIKFTNVATNSGKVKYSEITWSSDTTFNLTSPTDLVLSVTITDSSKVIFSDLNPWPFSAITGTKSYSGSSAKTVQEYVLYIKNTSTSQNYGMVDLQSITRNSCKEETSYNSSTNSQLVKITNVPAGNYRVYVQRYDYFDSYSSLIEDYALTLYCYDNGVTKFLTKWPSTSVKANYITRTTKLLPNSGSTSVGFSGSIGVRLSLTGTPQTEFVSLFANGIGYRSDSTNYFGFFRPGDDRGDVKNQKLLFSMLSGGKDGIEIGAHGPGYPSKDSTSKFFVSTMGDIELTSRISTIPSGELYSYEGPEMSNTSSPIGLWSGSAYTGSLSSVNSSWVKISSGKVSVSSKEKVELYAGSAITVTAKSGLTVDSDKINCVLSRSYSKGSQYTPIEYSGGILIANNSSSHKITTTISGDVMIDGIPRVCRFNLDTASATIKNLKTYNFPCDVIVSAITAGTGVCKVNVGAKKLITLYIDGTANIQTTVRFDSNDPNKGWSAMACSGTTSSDGLYFYVHSFKDNDHTGTNVEVLLTY